MGHFKLKLLPADAIPRDLAVGITMQRFPEGETVLRRQRTFSPPGGCVASFGSWDVGEPPVVDLDTPMDWTVWPSSDTVLCEGDCLDWSLELSGGASGSEPNITIEAGSDCAGVTIHVDDASENLTGWTWTVSASLAGSPFGTPYAVTLGDTDVGFLYSDDAGSTYDNVDSVSEHKPCEDAFYSGITIVVTTPDATEYDAGLFAWNVSQVGSNWSAIEGIDGSGRPTLTVTLGVSTIDACGESIRADPTYDGTPVNGPLEWIVDSA